MTNENVHSVEEAVNRALVEAKKAVSESSYGVGGMLVNANTGEIIKLMHNQVIKNEHLSDPTAHGERQLVDWYYENRKSLCLPAPHDIIIVTTLDPCYMCTGSILSSGFRTAVVAAYDDNAGINYKKDNTFKPLEGDMSSLIRSTFCYPAAIGNDEYQREAFGNIPELFKGGETFNSSTLKDCFDTFKDGMTLAREIVEQENNIVPLNPKSLSEDNTIVAALKEKYSNALSYTCPEPHKPDIKLSTALGEACAEDIRNGGNGNAVAFLDVFGNLLMCKPGRQDISPIRTAFMETLRAYSQLKYELGEAGRQYLCSTKLGTFVFYQGFDKSSVSLADMGAYGSSILGKFDNYKNLQYIVPAIPQSELEDYIGGMADRYKNTLKPMPVEDNALANWRYK